MENSLVSRIKHAWNVFKNGADPPTDFGAVSYGSYYRPDRPRLQIRNERSIINSVINRIAMDVAAIDIKHVQLDENDRFISEIDSDLNTCLTLESNIDQTARAFKQDVVMSMLDEGSVAVVPVDTTEDPKQTGSYDIQSMRTGKIVKWRPKYIVANIYNDRSGKRENVVVPKSMTAIIENPLYAVMNEPNSTMQRLIRKLNLLDFIDDHNSSGKLDLIIQLPYVVKSETKKQQAEIRRKEIEDQLVGSKYGIAYTDATEKITQLNRAVENNLMSQIEFLTKTLYGQLGITETVMDGTANEETMLNYYNRTLEPILAAICLEMKRKFITKTGRTQGKSIEFFRDPFRLVPVNMIAEIADKFTRNEILTSNEIRQIIGFKPSEDPAADELRNKNLNQQADPNEAQNPGEQVDVKGDVGIDSGGKNG